MEKILVVDDNQSVCRALTILLELHDFEVVCCNSPKEAYSIVMYQRISLAILDMNFTEDTTSGEEGEEAFYQLRNLQPDLPVILLTAWTELTKAVDLVKNGAADYLAKPWDDNKLVVTIKNLVEISDLNQKNAVLARQNRERSSANADANLCGLVFASTAMQRLVDMSVQVAKSDVSVLVTGPNGAGKERIADIIHANSARHHKPFIKVNVGALPADLMEAELFGAESGAYTGATKQRIGRFEAADGGTLFLDEIGNLPLSGQVKLLRVLQTGEFERLGSHQTIKVDVRVISATNADLKADIASGAFREDLYYRLNVIELNLPPLQQRTDDIAPLINHFTQTNKSLSKMAEQALLNHSWPGNVRELENACQRAMLFAKEDEWQPEDFGLPSDNISAKQPSAAPQMTQPQDDLTKEAIEACIGQHGGVISRAAKQLGLSRQALYRRMEKFGIDK